MFENEIQDIMIVIGESDGHEHELMSVSELCLECLTF